LRERNREIEGQINTQINEGIQVEKGKSEKKG
jgi:hypothetical protein